MDNGNKNLSALAVVSCGLSLVCIVLLTPLGSFAMQGVEESALLFFLISSSSAICGFLALRRTRRRAGMRGRPLAFVGCILGSGMVMLMVTVMALRIRAVNNFSVCGRNIKQIEDAAQTLPGCVSTNQDEKHAQIKTMLKQLPDGHLPECPGGGDYTITAPNGYTSCSKHGDRGTCNQGI